MLPALLSQLLSAAPKIFFSFPTGKLELEKIYYAASCSVFTGTLMMIARWRTMIFKLRSWQFPSLEINRFSTLPIIQYRSIVSTILALTIGHLLPISRKPGEFYDALKGLEITTRNYLAYIFHCVNSLILLLLSIFYTNGKPRS